MMSIVRFGKWLLFDFESMFSHDVSTHWINSPKVDIRVCQQHVQVYQQCVPVYLHTVPTYPRYVPKTRNEISERKTTLVQEIVADLVLFLALIFGGKMVHSLSSCFCYWLFIVQTGL